MKLMNYYRSTAAYRVRIALNYKDIDYELEEVDLIKEGGEQYKLEYLRLNPQGRVPSLILEDKVLIQSLAILEYLEEQYPNPPILPKNAFLRSKIRAFAQIIACDIHPLNNLGVLQYLKNTLNVSEDEKLTWYHHWLQKGFQALERILEQQPNQGKFCFGDEVTMADMCLIPQIYNANRFNYPMNQYPNLLRINEYCLSLDYFKKAAP